MLPATRAVVLSGPNDLSVQEFERPVSGELDAVLRIEACGLCGSDIEQIRGTVPNPVFPVVPGHEPVGVIESIGATASERWGVRAGDRVCVEVVVPCLDCRGCETGLSNGCERPLGTYGFRPIPGDDRVSGGFAEYMYVHPNSTLHRISNELPARVAAMYNSVAAGIRWVQEVGQVSRGDTVVVLGCGQRGIAAAMAAKEAGADLVIVTGLERDAHKLGIAEKFGADVTIFADREDVPGRVHELTEGRLADVILDLTPMAGQPVRDALAAVRRGGRVVLAGLKSGQEISVNTDLIVKKSLTVVGALGVEGGSIKAAIALLESGRYPFELMQTHTFGLDDVAQALAVLASEVEGEDAVHVAILP
ncbi:MULTISPECIES: zinc-binding dehydrogenase [unclassified Microbacterium]|uniref:zinc-dependent alcohol dehydrogenase n=1 Tax=unclassified Microbacterium TaxID=2609290 RepID=UPI00214B3D2D|nr:MULTISPECIES: zinc-binding dehydrogenase [unclassified Microbacterium]MCR2808390.1 zinc-binding dehydrogenase [Microbacterium sp. zg.B185]WIM19164.1 zinc-binding dehydrogenase [Microbacterium sp. zg-B185]